MAIDPPNRIRIGTCGYSYPAPPPRGWTGLFYPSQRGRRVDPLEYYSRFFDTVEINSSFYGPPSASMAHAWAGKTDPDFSFTLKLWQKFTHPRKVGQGGATGEWEAAGQADVDLFRAGIQPLADAGKLGALVLQYPAGFVCNPENLDKLAGVLRSFADYPRAVELRHKSWSDQADETKSFLEQNGAGWVVIDEPKFASSIRQSFEPVSGMFYFRAHGRNAQAWWTHKESWERYDYCYSRDEIKRMAGKIREAASKSGLRAFALFNNHAGAQAPANALMFKHELGLPPPGRPNEALLRKFPELAEIFPAPPEKSLLNGS
ncbi:MAG: DUF72 domain-containing protein [Candidatus Binatia bacterium]